jgi:hypothetical protein
VQRHEVKFKTHHINHENNFGLASSYIAKINRPPYHAE